MNSRSKSCLEPSASDRPWNGPLNAKISQEWAVLGLQIAFACVDAQSVEDDPQRRTRANARLGIDSNLGVYEHGIQAIEVGACIHLNLEGNLFTGMKGSASCATDLEIGGFRCQGILDHNKGAS